MRICILCCLVVLTSPQSFGQAPNRVADKEANILSSAAVDTPEKSKSVTTRFNGIDYQLAWVDPGDSNRAITNEYVTEDEDVKNWTAMIAVRHWPKFSQVRQVVGPYLRQIQPHFVRDANVFQPDKANPGTELVIECYLAPPDKSYLEYNLIRFGIEPGEQGVKSYQFALRGPYNLESALEFNQNKLALRLDELTALRQKSYTQLPNSAATETKGAELDRSTNPIQNKVSE